MPHPNSKFDISQIRKELQQIILGIMGEDVRSIPDDIPILDLGVSSLALVEGMRQVYDRFGVLVSIRRVIEGQITLGTLALYIEEELVTQKSKEGVRTAASQWKIERRVPLAPSQQHLAFLSRYSNEAGAAFHESLILRLYGALHGPALHTAIEEAGNRFESLRTALATDGDVLEVGTGEPLELVVASLPPDKLRNRINEIVAHPFEIGKRLFRAELLRLSETKHVLILVGHALVLDQQALAMVAEDVAGLYSAFARDEAAGALPPTLQWTDYLSMGETAEAKEFQHSAENYWKKLSVSELPSLELPADLPRPAVKKYIGSRADIELDSTITRRIQTLAKSTGVDQQTILLSAFTIFLHRLADVNDLLIGIETQPIYPNAGLRVIAQTHNTLPARSAYEPRRSFKDHLQATAKSLSNVNEHRYLSLGELIRLLNVPRDQSRSPLFSAAFRAYTQLPTPAFGSLKSSQLVSPSCGARYDIELLVLSSANGIRLVCDFSTELFETNTISRWLKGMVALLEAALQEPGQQCGLLPMMSGPERDKILFTWNETEKSFPRERTLLDAILEQAKTSPEATAIRFGGSSLSYSQLVERVEQIASELHQRGVKRGSRVGVIMKRSLDLIPTLLAIWRVGAAYVPTDVNFPVKRIAYVITDASVQLIVTNRDTLDHIDNEHRAIAFCIEDIGKNSTAPIDVPSAVGTDSAYIIYTSGSTGKPKGVEVLHSALLNCMLATQEYLAFSPQSSMLALTTVSFDISTVEIFMPLMAGGYVEVGEDGLVVNGLQLAERIEAHQPSHMQATPSTFKSLLTAGWQGNEKIYLISAGEALSRDLAEELLMRCNTLWNLYGPTETTVYSSASHVTSEPDKPVQIGRPFPNTQMYVLDRQYQPVPIGSVGDLYIGGDGLAVGYWHKLELTGERFVPNPFRTDERMYRTGDLARYLPNGNIVCLGRMDDQVKIHGVRVELGEIETALRNISGVEDAVATAWEDTHGNRQLVAHIIQTRKGMLSISQIRALLRESLPDVMIPPYILFAESFPHTANGKIQRSALPSPETFQPRADRKPLEAPDTVTEKSVAEVWANALGIDSKIIGRDSDFMELGGHSLLMTVLMVEVRKRFQVNFNMREFFGASTLRKFAALIDERLQQADEGTIQSFASTRTVEWARQRMAYLQREAELPSYIAPARGMTFQPAEHIRSVLLTGATGFLGCYIVAEILKTTDAVIHCLVRPRRGEDSKERIERQMKRYHVWGQDEVWASAWESRLRIVDGDVTLPRLGMKDSDYETLAREVDAIFHSAAHVNFIYPYEALRATNVLGIQEIIQFAFYARIKPVHHLSTAAIWPMGAQHTYYERDPIDHYGRLNLGYDEAKWVGEKCLLNAAERGLPVARYRPGEVGGDSVTGQCVTDHFIIACFKGFLQFGAFPDLDIEVDVAPVDYVARSMVYLAFQRNVLGRAFHLTNPSRRRLSDGLAYLHGIGYKFEHLPFEELRNRLVASPGFSSNALFAYQAALEDMDNVSMQLPTYDTCQVEKELAGSGIACPPADEKLFGAYLHYLQNIGFVPQPEALLTHT